MGKLQKRILALLRNRSLSGREIIAELGIGKHRVYDCLRSLVEGGSVVKTVADPPLYGLASGIKAPTLEEDKAVRGLVHVLQQSPHLTEELRLALHVLRRDYRIRGTPTVSKKCKQ